MELSQRTVSAIVERLYESGVVTDYANEYGEPGYDFTIRADTETPMFLMGDWWCKCGHHPRAGKPDRGFWGNPDQLVQPDALHSVQEHHPRLWDQLERQGVETVFYDEWIVDHEHGKAYRTQPDCYQWQPTAIITDVGDLLTPDHDIEEWIGYMVNSPTRCLPETVFSEGDLRAAGFEPYSGLYENGWHPGQNDDPHQITDKIRAERGDTVDIVFYLDGTSQFYIEFTAWIRPKE